VRGVDRGTVVDLRGGSFICAGRLAARVSRRVRGFQVPGWGRWSGLGGQSPQPGKNLGEQPITGREPQDQLASVADQPRGDGDSQ
jgi:hypothetical protein